MPYQIFQYILPGPADTVDLNAFLAARRVVSVQQHFVTAPGGGLLVFVVHYTEGSDGAARLKTTGMTGNRKVDYRTELTTEQFAVFDRLREERRKLAQAEGVPVYTLFSNEQLAEMVRRPVATLTEMGSIDGIGPGALEKYGSRLLAILAPGTDRAADSKQSSRA